MNSETMGVTSELSEVEHQIATGKRLNRMSQEPWSIAQLHQLREKIDVQENYQKASKMAMGLLSQGETALSMIMNAVNRTREISVQASNDVLGVEDLDAIMAEVSNIKERVLALANSDFNGRYIFSGTAYDTPPYDSNYVYQGTTDTVDIAVADNSSVEVNFDGSDVFQGSTDIFAAFDALINGLQNDDDTLIQSAIDQFDDVFDHINKTRTQMGTEMNIAMDMDEIAETLEANLRQRLSDVEDADMPEALTRFSQLQTQYQINLQLTAKMRTMSLFERM
jgi:flagellar hook-associated protein 3 FlgL